MGSRFHSGTFTTTNIEKKSPITMESDISSPPYCLVWSEDHYYAIGYSEKYQKIGIFRVDRMKEVNILSADAAVKPTDFNLPEFTRRVFDMYDGETKKVTLVCKNDLMNYIVDRCCCNMTQDISAAEPRPCRSKSSSKRSSDC